MTELVSAICAAGPSSAAPTDSLNERHWSRPRTRQSRMEAARIDVKELTSPDEHARPQAHYGRRALMAVAAASTLAVSAFGTVLLLRSPAATGVDLVHESVAT